jgi:hypothetical protein
MLAARLPRAAPERPSPEPPAMPSFRRAAPAALLAGMCVVCLPPGRASGQEPQASADSALARSRAVMADTAGVGRLGRAASLTRAARVRELGPGQAGRLLREVLGRPRLVVVPETTLVLGRDARVDSSLVVIGTVYSGARVRGDVVALGDLFLRPGAVVEGRAIAIGGGVYPSSLAEVRGETLAFRDLEAGTVSLDGRALPASTALAIDIRDPRPAVVSRVLFPGTLGLRIPLYDRIDGASVTVGPEISLDTGRVRLEPTLTYRTHLGAVDPALRASFEPRGGRRLELRVQRGTFTNEEWIRSDLVNSATVLASGIDVRNYFRADRAELVLFRRLARGATVLAPYAGVLAERSWSVPRDSLATSLPYSVWGRDDVEGVRRPNPAVTGGRLASVLLGLTANGAAGEYQIASNVRLEAAPLVQRAEGFAQATLDLQVGRPLFRTHLAELFAHTRVSAGGDVPSQRWGYLGGNGTLPSTLLLTMGGDQLLFGELRYTVPVPGVRLPLVGAPLISARWIAGTAGVRSLPAPTHNVGLRLALGFVRVEYLLDPTGKGRRAFGVGLGLLR